VNSQNSIISNEDEDSYDERARDAGRSVGHSSCDLKLRVREINGVGAKRTTRRTEKSGGGWLLLPHLAQKLTN
jgi:hypothetical protein